MADVVDPVESVRARMAQLAALEQGWLDGYGEPIEPGCITAATELIEAAMAAGMPRPVIAPLESGGVTFEWLPAGRLLSVEVEPGEPVMVYEGGLRVDDDLREHAESDVASALGIVTAVWRAICSAPHEAWS